MILVVEDNKTVLKNMEIMLRFNNYTCAIAQNGEEALDVLERLPRPPDVIVCDIMMPRMDGYELYEHISNDTRYSNIPFMFVTAKSSPDDIRLGKMLGVDDYITKPFEEEDLLATIAGKIKRTGRQMILKVTGAIRKALQLDLIWERSVSAMPIVLVT